jgi:hypothetical protein
MAEKIVSPGVFTKEVDQSFLPAGVQAIGAAIIGPTAKGPAGIPTIISSYSEFTQIFGGKFSSGSGAFESSYKYLTNYAAQEYLKYADTLTVVRIAPGAAPATSAVTNATASGFSYASGSPLPIGNGVVGQRFRLTSPSGTATTFVAAVDGTGDSGDGSIKFFAKGASTTAFAANLATEINAAGLGVTADTVAAELRVSASNLGTGGNGFILATASADTPTSFGTTNGVSQITTAGGTNTTTSTDIFTLTTLSDGFDMNSVGPEGTNNALASGSENNIRWEVTSKNTNKGTFNLILRRGDDTSNRKIILEQYNNLTLDPNSSNYIAKVIGDQRQATIDAGTTDPFLQLTGDYQNRSKFVRVSVHRNTINYLDANGEIRDANLTGFLPVVSSGSFSGGNSGSISHPGLFYEQIDNTNSQGYNPGSDDVKNAYIDAIRLLKNQDEYDINLLTLPGLIDNLGNHATILTEAINMVEARSDCFLVIDPVEHGATLATATAKAEARDSNYVAEYWPWIKVPDNELGRNVWVPASTVIPSVYAFNDRVAAPWFAPAGLNRGGIDIAVQTERKLTHANRDTLYESNVNPIATFPNSGVVVFGQKTLQKKASALDRVNVRRLLIAAKKFIASTTKFLIFENNTAATRNRFLSIVNPYFENVQQRQGLYAFKVVMDETNNTPDVIDRNQMVGQIFMQPAKAAEFIIIDFNILPTGAAFPE